MTMISFIIPTVNNSFLFIIGLPAWSLH